MHIVNLANIPPKIIDNGSSPSRVVVWSSIFTHAFLASIHFAMKLYYLYLHNQRALFSAVQNQVDAFISENSYCFLPMRSCFHLFHPHIPHKAPLHFGLHEWSSISEMIKMKQPCIKISSIHINENTLKNMVDKLSNLVVLVHYNNGISFSYLPWHDM